MPAEVSPLKASLRASFSDDTTEKLSPNCGSSLKPVIATGVDGKALPFGLPRKSVIEFGWTVGIPEKNNTETYIHTKLVSDAGEKGSGEGGSNEGQNIFHRPANHGIYAFVCNVDVYRLGFNDISRHYSINDEERNNRYKALLQSLLSSFINPQGAMTSTQKPHITDFKGVVSVSRKLIPAPTISALNPDYRQEIEEIKNNINSIEEDAIQLMPFNGLGELSKIIVELIGRKPYRIG